MFHFLRGSERTINDKDENLIVDDMGEAGLAIFAIEFEVAFAFSSKTEAIVSIVQPGFTGHFDIDAIKATLKTIEDLKPDEIRYCCSASAEWLNGKAHLILEALIARQQALRRAMIVAN